MSEAKKELEIQKERVIAKMNDWQNDVAWSRGQIDEVLRRQRVPAKSDVEISLSQVSERLFKASESIQKAANDLEYLENFFKFQKNNFEVRKTILDSWPESRFIERMLWVATILISLGGGAFGAGMALSAGDFLASVFAPIVFWAVGLSLLVWYLIELRKVDQHRMELYRSEFGIAKDSNRVRRKQ